MKGVVPLSETKKCPLCGAALPEEAAFCPHCARSIQPRAEAAAPRLWGRLLRPALVFLAALLAAGAYWYGNRPQVIDPGGAELRYTLDGAEYQIVAGWIDNRFEGAQTVYQPVEEKEMRYTFPQALYINDPASGADAREPFLEQVERITAQFVRTDNPDRPWTCDEPVPRPDYVPGAVRITSIHFTAWSGEGDMVWEIEMKNGDLLRLRQHFVAKPYQVLRFTPEDTAMDTVEALQALVDSIPSRLSSKYNGVEITLPPVRYEGGLAVDGFNVTIYGSEDGAGNRTAFTGPVRVTGRDRGISYLEHIDILGPGEGVGVSASARLHLTDCRVAGWRTGVLAYGDQVWINLRACTVEDNGVGFHFNAAGSSASRTIYDGNLFRRNGTAVLLERLPGVESISFPGCRFTENGTDIDNRCGQALDLEETIFE